MFTTVSIITASALAVLGFLLGPLSCRLLNKIPAKWLCDYDEEPSEELLSGNRFKIKPTGFIAGAIIAAALAGTTLFTGVTPELIFYVILYSLLLLISESDAKYTIIPDQFTIAVAVVSLIFAVTDYFTDKNFISSWYDPLLGAASGFAILVVLDLFSTLVFKKTGFGFGHIKLMAAVGLMFGLKYVLIVLMFSAFVSAFHFLYLIFSGKGKNGIYLPMGPYICIAIVLTIMLRVKIEPIFSMYKMLMDMEALP